MGSQWDRPMKFNEWWAIRSQALRDLEMTPAEWYKVFAGTNIDTGGTPQLMLDTSGRVTEVSAATIGVNTGYIANLASKAGIPLVVGPPYYNLGVGVLDNFHLRKNIVTLAAADGGGAVAATALVTGPAGYYPVIDSLLVYSTVADTFTATFAAVTGALVGPATHSITTVASTINRQLEDLLLYNLTDASGITVAITGATVGMVISFVVYYHYET